jgi:hypothetical protein
MSTLRLREPLQKAVAKVHSLSDGAIAELSAALQAAEVEYRPSRLAEAVAMRVNSISRLDVDLVVEGLAGLAYISTSADMSLDMFVDDVLEAIANPEIKYSLQLSTDQQQTLRVRLLALLNNDTITTAAKARSVFVEQQHQLCFARIVTDIRPVFGADVSSKPTAALIAHTLKIVYHEGDATKEFFVALDSNGLDNLTGLIERAKAKEEALKRFVLGTADVKSLGTGPKRN